MFANLSHKGKVLIRLTKSTMKRSVARETSWFVILTITLVVLVEVFSQHFLTRYNLEIAQRRAQTDVNGYALTLQREIDFYRNILGRLGRRAEVYNLLEFGNTAESSAWAQNYRKLLPDAVGLTLVNRDGEIQGDPRSLLIGPLCRIDIAKISRGEQIIKPAIHREHAGLEHFDVYTKIADVDGEQLGYLFASFKIGIIQSLLETMVHEGHKLTVTTSTHSRVASVDFITHASDALITLSQPVQGTDWTIALEAQPEGMQKSTRTILFATSLLALLVGFSVILLSRHLSKGLLNEISNICSALKHIAEGDGTAVDIKPHFHETTPLITALQDIFERVQAQKAKLAHASETDSLTGLFNRRRFTQELEKAWALASRQVSVYVIALDLDGFKHVNDRYGHARGDQVLKSLADCLRACTRGTDISARLGGDEFMVLLVHSNKTAGLDFFNRLSDHFRQAQATLSIGAELRCTLSAGLIHINTDVYADAEAVLHRVDEALYLAKQSGKNQIHYVADPDSQIL